MTVKISELPAGTPPIGTEISPFVQGGTTVSLTAQQVANLAPAVTANRIKLTGTTTYFVTATGSDVTGDGSAGLPWATLQHAIDYFSSSIDFAGQQLILSIGAGSFVGVGMKSLVGGGNLYIRGNGSASTTIIGGPNDGIYNFGDAITVNQQYSTVLSIDQVTLAPGASGAGINIALSNTVTFVGDFLTNTITDFVFGPATYAAATLRGTGGLIFGVGSVDINMGASCARFLHVADQGYIDILATIFNCIGATNFTLAFLHAEHSGAIDCDFGTAWINPGNFTGKRFDIYGAAYIDAGNILATDIPGSTMGIVNSGGELNCKMGTHVDTALYSDDFHTVLSHTFADIPSTATFFDYTGMIAHVQDSPTQTYNEIIATGGGAYDVLARMASDGTWRVMASDVPFRKTLTADTLVYISNFSGTIVGGALYTAGQYYDVPMNGGSGVGMTAHIKVTAGAITTVSPLPNASTYAIGDVLTVNAADVGGTGAGFSFTITAIGSDTTGDGSISKPWKTLQHAVDTAAISYELAGNVLVFQLIDGVYPGVDFYSGWDCQGFIQIQGNRSNVNAAVVDNNIGGPSGPSAAFRVHWNGIYVPQILISDIEVRNKANSGYMFYVNGPCMLRWWDKYQNRSGNMYFRFRVASSPQIQLLGSDIWFQDWSSVTTLDYTDTVPAPASAQRSFYDADGLCFGSFQSITNVRGAPNYSDSFFKLTSGAALQYNYVGAANSSFAGVVGKQVVLNPHTVLETFGSSLASIPGNATAADLNGGTWFDAFRQIYSGASMLQMRHLNFSNLPAATDYDGMMARIWDSSTATLNDIVSAGGGANHVTLASDGTNWRVIIPY